MFGATNTLQSTEPTVVYYLDLLRLSSIFKASLFWVNEERVRSKRVLRFRKYFDGDHDAGLNTEMKNLLRIQDSDDGFTLNLMPSVVNTMADRCIVQSIDALEDKKAQAKLPMMADAGDGDANSDDILSDPTRNPAAWIQDVMERNRFDILQGEIHQAAIRDADSYLMASWDNDDQCVRWTFEEAFDGSTGMLAYYPSRNIPKMAAAIKVWQIQTPTELTQFQFAIRANVYYPDRIEKYQAMGTNSFEPFIEEGETTHILPWTDRSGKPLGIPVIHFRNGGRHNFGVSELRNAISPQNALNRFNYSAVMIAELTAFSILVARGHEPPATITPAMIYTISSGAPIEQGQIADLTRLAAGDMGPILEIIDKERHLIADITRTPSSDLIGSGGKSGEYLKQLEVGLLGKVRAFQTRAGASWEQVGDLSHRIQAAFGVQQPPAYKRFRTVWRSAELRNDSEVVKNAVMMDVIWGHEQTLKATANVFDLDEEKIASIMAEQKEAAAQAPALMESVNPMKGTVSVKEAPIDIGAQGDTVKATDGTPSAQVNSPSKPSANKPAIKGSGKKLPPGQALTVHPITPEEVAAVTALHRKMVKAG